jgi:hypothetical protein
MNQRIKELSIKAGFPEWSNHAIEFELEKFAELIIRDCVGVVENMSPGYQDYRNQIEDAFRRDCVEEIKYKFEILDQKN